MISEWPVRPDARRGAPPPRAVIGTAASDRDLVRDTVELFAEGSRIGDRVRAWATGMCDALVGAVERDMRLFVLPLVSDRPELAASFGSPFVAIAVPLLADAGVLRHPPLAAVLLRQARTADLRHMLDPVGDDAPRLLVDDPDAAVATPATALLIAQARRRDRFGEPTLVFDDLSADLAHWMAWRIAAALRHYLRVRHYLTDHDADALLLPAVASVLATHDEGHGVDAYAAQLAAGLLAADRIDGTLLAALLSAGEVPAFTAALAAAAGLPLTEVWNLVADPARGRLALLLRAVGADRDAAATVLLLLLGPGADAATEIDSFDRTPRAAAARALAPLATDPEYRAAIHAVDTALAIREVTA